MKIALVIRRYDSVGGGAERWTDRHARMLLQRGHEVHLVATEIAQPPNGAICHVIDGHVRTRHRARMVIAQRIADFFKAHRYDVIHDMGVGWHCDVFMPHHGTHRVVYDQRSRMLAAPERWLRPLAYHLLPRYRQFQKMERQQYAPSPDKRFIAVSPMVASHMVQHHKVPEDRVHVVYNGVDVDHFQPAKSSEVGDRIRRQLGFTDQILFLIVAEDWDLKGLATILRATRRLVADKAHVGLIVVGTGAMKGHKIFGIHTGRARDRFPSMSRKLGCDHAVRFVGHQLDPLPYYQAADVYVQPSLYDTCSLVILEAMACGLPVITSRSTGVHSLIAQDIEGHIIADPQNVGDLAHAMKLYLDPARRSATGSHARRRALECSAQSNYDQIMAVYQAHLRNTAAPSAPRQQPATIPAYAGF